MTKASKIPDIDIEKVPKQYKRKPDRKYHGLEGDGYFYATLVSNDGKDIRNESFKAENVATLRQIGDDHSGLDVDKTEMVMTTGETVLSVTPMWIVLQRIILAGGKPKCLSSSFIRAAKGNTSSTRKPSNSSAKEVQP